MNQRQVKRKLLQNPEFRKEYNKMRIPWEMTRVLIKLRNLKGFTQAKLAKLMKVNQSVVSRAESGSHVPSLVYLKKVADACDTELILPTFSALKNSDQESAESGKEDKIIKSSNETLVYIIDSSMVFSNLNHQEKVAEAFNFHNHSSVFNSDPGISSTSYSLPAELRRATA